MALTVGMTHEMRLKTGPEHYRPKIFLRKSPMSSAPPSWGGCSRG